MGVAYTIKNYIKMEYHQMHTPQQHQQLDQEIHTSMWLDVPYALNRDSGIHSGTTNSLRSVLSGCNDSEQSFSTTMSNNEQQRFQHSVAPPCTPHQRHPQQHQPPVQLPIPEQQQPQIDPNITMMGQRREPGEMISELISLLNDDDRLIVSEAVMFVHTLIKEGGDIRLDVIRNREIIIALLRAFSKDSGDGQLIYALTSLLHFLSQQQDGLVAILEAGGIRALLHVLDSSDNIVNFVITILHNFLIILQANAAREIESFHGTEKFVSLLNRTNDKLLTLLTDCLHKMACYNQEAKTFLQGSEMCSQQLLRIMVSTRYDKLLLTISKLFPIISSGTVSTKKTILLANGIEILEKQINKTKSIRIRRNCLLTIRNISDQAIKLKGMESLIQTLIQLLLTDDLVSITCSVGILNNLTCDNQINKMHLVKMNGIQALIKTILQAGEKEEIIEPALCTLRHVTARHELEAEARDSVKKLCGIPYFVKLLNIKHWKKDWPTVKATIGLIKNLALSASNLSSLRENGAIPKLVQLLTVVDQERQQIQKSHEDIHHMNNLNHTEHTLDIIIGALHTLAKNQTNRIIIRELNCIPIFVRCHYLPHCQLQRTSSEMLNELRQDLECNQIIETQLGTQKVLDFLKQ
ncbi:unnamed protein product [Didymodactylos carnosus]|uniref:Uncharacterized protein n=1 Tax=Didymodactylos carnosus TaxID=1234261 RepID=A0A814EL25_9BILA|nr:unnamed protein product [Didymodactylos carnosus]CAF0968760.1 unnamed protein product [Didymodactylos carnosus]CAF3626746.1 unnamed protein product [Didymodactylos carnosus]CAF3741997.1 unnamed protein product [Didymodactylos carnosus]